MNGAGIRLPSQARKTIEPATMTVSHAHGGTRRTLSTKLDLGEAPRQLGGLGRAGLDPDVGRGGRDVAEHRVRHRVAARSLLERGGVEVGGAIEVVLAADELEPRGRHRRSRARSSRASSSSAA